MLFTILSLFFAAIVTPLLYTKSKNGTVALMMIIVVSVVLFYAAYVNSIVGGLTFSSSHTWSSTLHVHLTFYLDGLSLFFSLLISVFGLLILLYAIKYMKGESHEGRFFSFLFLFMGAMLGIVLSDNLISLFVFWELTSFSSFLLIGFKNEDKNARYAARQALLVTSGGGLALMAGFILLNIFGNGNFTISELMNSREVIQSGTLIHAVIILILTGAFTKSAQFPFHFWLPNAMEAPTPVSAYLHSATMVKAGVYLVFRLNPLFHEVDLWGELLLIIGAVTMVLGAAKAFREDDLKKVLAFTTISALGIFFLMIGVGTKEAINAGLVYVMAHALYKGTLFLVAGNIDHETGTREISRLSDLGKKMPYTATAAVLASASMAGIIPFIGFTGKELLYDSLYHSSQVSLWPLILVMIASLFFVAISIEIAYNIFFQKGPAHNQEIHEASFPMFLSPVVLGVISLLAGLVPSVFGQALLNAASFSVYDEGAKVSMKLWHGFNIILLLSVTTILAGVAIYFFRSKIRGVADLLFKSRILNADFIYRKAVDVIQQISDYQTRIIQNGYLRSYIAVIILLFSVLAIGAMLQKEMLYLSWETIMEGMQIYEVAILILICISILILFKTHSRLIVAANMGIAGYGIALAYTLFSAPDVAITQFLAETLILILLILILHRLPRYTISSRPSRPVYLFVSMLFGASMTLISLMMLSNATPSDLKEYFLTNSVSKGKGENTVNVILVDFRAFDTMGEITVLTVTMTGIIALLRLNKKEKEI